MDDQLSYPAADAILDALLEQGVTHLFVNLGSDHPGIVEAIARRRAQGRPVPRIITCPNEMAGMSAAHGFWLASGAPQAVMVHVECGTQALAGAVHNAAKGRAPMLVLAGASPFTQNGELPGSRNEFIQWIQDVHDQAGIVRGYMRYTGEIRSARNVREVISRAFQFATSDPKGPAYLICAREVLEDRVPAAQPAPRTARPIEPVGLAPAALDAVGRALLDADRPLIVTSYLGRNPSAVAPLVRLCERLGIGVLESVPNAVNFPHGNPLYRGNQWNQPMQNAALAEADLVLVIDSDVPWIRTVSRPAPEARILHIDVDPLKEQMPLALTAPDGVYRADAETALTQLDAWCAAQTLDEGKIRRRCDHHESAHRLRGVQLSELEKPPAAGLTAPYAIACFRKWLTDDTLVMNESISSYHHVFDHLALDQPGALYTSGGGSLGWNGGAAFGAKLAAPERTVVAFTGDGSFMFSVPSSVFWMARRYKAPFLTVIFNNRGWKSPKLSALAVHPSGYAAEADDLDTSFEPSPDYIAIAAAAGDAWGRRVRTPAELEAAYAEALRVLHEEGRCAVIDVWLDHH